LLERRVKELVIITASATNECQFCVSSHCDLVMVEDLVDQPLVVIDTPGAMSPREATAVDYTRAAMHDSNDIPEPLMARIHALFSDPELVELSFLIGFINMLNLFNNLLRVRYEGGYSLLERAS
jgi:alkylhydroperoxidase family enzyme